MIQQAEGRRRHAPAEYRNGRQKTLVGFSLKVVAPTGQYDPTSLLNWGANRRAFRPKLGLSHRRGHWGRSHRHRATSAAQLLVRAGEPIGEPVVQHGPFVMNTERDKSGEFGHLED